MGICKPLPLLQKACIPGAFSKASSLWVVLGGGAWADLLKLQAPEFQGITQQILANTNATIHNYGKTSENHDKADNNKNNSNYYDKSNSTKNTHDINYHD